MNKLQEIKLKKIIKEEYRKILKEMDVDAEKDTSFKYFMDQLNKFIEDNSTSEYQPQIKFFGEMSNSKFLSVNMDLLKELLTLIQTKKHLFKKQK